MSTAATNKAVARQLYEDALGRGDFSVVQEIVAEDFVNHSDPHAGRGPESVVDTFETMRAVAPTYRFIIEHLIAEGDLVAVHGRGITGPMRGSYRGRDLTGRSSDAAHVHILRFREGQIVEHWGVRQDGGL